MRRVLAIFIVCSHPAVLHEIRVPIIHYCTAASVIDTFICTVMPVAPPEVMNVCATRHRTRILMREKFKWVSDCVTYRTPAFIIRAAIVSIFFHKQIFAGIVGLVVHVELQSAFNIGVFCIFIHYFNIVFIFYLYSPYRLSAFQRVAIGECFFVPYAGQHGVFAPPLVVSVITGK